MMENKYKLGDLFFPVAVAIKDAKDSPYDKFVGLEHYDSLEPVINRFTDTSLLSSSVKEFHTGDMLVARRNVYLKRAGLALFDGLTSGDSIVLRLKQESEIPEGLERDVLSRILPFVLNSENFWIYANKHADGMNSKRISIDNLLNYEFDLPSLAEQKVLTEKLWAAYEVKQSYLKMIDATQEMVKAQFVEMFGNPISNDKHWKTDTISKVAPESPSKETVSGNVWLLNLDMIEPNTGKVLDKVYENSDNTLSVAPFDEENVLYSKLRPYLNKVIVPDEKGLATTELVPLRPDKERLNKYFLCHLLRSDQFVNFANNCSGGTKMPRMSLSELRNFNCILPPMNLQNQFVDIAFQADKSKAELRKSIKAIDKVIKSLINENL